MGFSSTDLSCRGDGTQRLVGDLSAAPGTVRSVSPRQANYVVQVWRRTTSALNVRRAK